MDRIQNLLLENGYELTDRNYKILSENIDNGNKTILILPEDLDVQSINEDNIVEVLSNILAENEYVVDDENLNILCEGLFDSSILLEKKETKPVDDASKGTTTDDSNKDNTEEASKDTDAPKDGDKKAEKEAKKKEKKENFKKGFKKATSNETVGKVVKSVAKSALIGAGAGAVAGTIASNTANVVKDKAVVDAAAENATAQAAKNAADEHLKDTASKVNQVGKVYVGKDTDVAAHAQAKVDAKTASENAEAAKTKLDTAINKYDGKRHNVGKEAAYGAAVGAGAGVGVNAAIKGVKGAHAHIKSKKSQGKKENKKEAEATE